MIGNSQTLPTKISFLSAHDREIEKDYDLYNIHTNEISDQALMELAKVIIKIVANHAHDFDNSELNNSKETEKT